MKRTVEKKNGQVPLFAYRCTIQGVNQNLFLGKYNFELAFQTAIENSNSEIPKSFKKGTKERLDTCIFQIY